MNSRASIFVGWSIVGCFSSWLIGSFNTRVIAQVRIFWSKIRHIQMFWFSWNSLWVDASALLFEGHFLERIVLADHWKVLIDVLIAKITDGRLRLIFWRSCFLSFSRSWLSRLLPSNSHRILVGKIGSNLRRVFCQMNRFVFPHLRLLGLVQMILGVWVNINVWDVLHYLN